MRSDFPPPYSYPALLILGISKEQRGVRGGQEKLLSLCRQLPNGLTRRWLLKEDQVPSPFAR